MSRFRRAIRSHVLAELHMAREAEARGEPEVAFKHLERAHVLGQASTLEARARALAYVEMGLT